MSTYLYGVMRAPPTPKGQRKSTVKGARKTKRVAPPPPVPDFGHGVGDPPGEVRLLRHGPVAALVSDVLVDDMESQGVRALRHDMKAHAAVLNAAVRHVTVLPFRFGILMPDDDWVIARVLAPQAERFAAYLDELEGAVELTLRGTYVEERVLEEVVTEDPKLSPRRGAQSYQAKLETGRRIAAALQAKQRADERALLAIVRPLVRDVRLGEASSELVALNASLLIDRDALPRFDRALARLDEREGHRIRFDCLGPLPPYSFVEMRL